jgi:catechol 2,3-dioxygenase-like lactoylglutathione lyase family enzyme
MIQLAARCRRRSSGRESATPAPGRRERDNPGIGMRIANVVFDAPGSTLDVYARSAGSIAGLYSDLLGMRLRSRADAYREANYPADEGDEADPLVTSDDPNHPSMAFECETATYSAPAWPDPERPQQAHLDVAVADLDAAHELVYRHGAALLRDSGTHRVYADRVGHPFCLYPGGKAPVGRIARVVIDCFSPRALAAFYSELFGMPVRLLDEPERVEIARSDGGVALAFQHTVSPAPRWPDPAYPQQLHLDLVPDDPGAAVQLAARLGAMRLPLPPKRTVWADPSGHPFCLLRT